MNSEVVTSHSENAFTCTNLKILFFYLLFSPFLPPIDLSSPPHPILNLKPKQRIGTNLPFYNDLFWGHVYLSPLFVKVVLDAGTDTPHPSNVNRIDIYVLFTMLQVGQSFLHPLHDHFETWALSILWSHSFLGLGVLLIQNRIDTSASSASQNDRRHFHYISFQQNRHSIIIGCKEARKCSPWPHRQ